MKSSNTPPSSIVIFDMDKTLLASDSMALWYLFLEEQGVITEADKAIRARLYQDYVKGVLDVQENFRIEFSMLNRIPADKKIIWQKQFFEEYVKPTISNKALDLIKKYRDEKTLIILSTSTMRFIAEPVANFIKTDVLIATDGCLIDDRYTGEVVGSANYGIGKKINFFQWLEKNKLQPKKIIFYSDSINDLDLLKAVHVPIAVNPDDKLHKHAKENAWEIIKFY